MNLRSTLIALAMTTASIVHAAEWKRLSPLPEPNGGSICGAVEGKIVVAGGTNWKDGTKRWLDRVWTFDPAGLSWHDAGRLPASLAYAATGSDARSIWFAGGSSGIHTHRDLRRIDRSLTATSMAFLERGFVYAGSAVIGSKLYVVGGSDDQEHFERITNHVYSIDLRNGRFVQLASYPERGFGVGAVAVCGNQLYVFGGAHTAGPTNEVVNLSSANVYSTGADRWTPLKPLPSPRRGVTAVTLDDHRILVAGGYKNDQEEFTAEAFIYDTKRDEYSATQPLPYAAMVGLVKLGDRIYCIAGEDKKKQRTDAFYSIPIRELLKAAK